jgi:pheromone shutdown protein TraB
MDIAPQPKARVRILGTSHIAQSSAREIERVAKDFDPDIIAVELDRRRLRSLMEQAAGVKDQRLPLSMIRQVGVTGYIFIAIGKIVQRKLGGIVKVDPGVDMLAAVRYAQSNGKALHVVDQDIMVTTRRLSQQFTFREKMRVVCDLIRAPFSKDMKKVKLRLDQVPDAKTLDMLMRMLKERYPSLYNVLIIERNIVMARNLDRVVRQNPGRKVLLVIGAGHGDDLRQRLKSMESIADIL